MTDDIEGRIRRVMLRLQLLSEGKALNLDPRTSSGKAEDRRPPGAREDFNPNEPPPKDRSLFEWYDFQFARASSDHRRHLLCYLAERDYFRYVKPAPNRSFRGEGYERPEDRDDRILSMYQGVHALEAAVFEQCSEAHIRKLRSSRKWASGSRRYDASWGTEMADAGGLERAA